MRNPQNHSIFASLLRLIPASGALFCCTTMKTLHKTNSVFVSFLMCTRCRPRPARLTGQQGRDRGRGSGDPSSPFLGGHGFQRDCLGRSRCKKGCERAGWSLVALWTSRPSLPSRQVLVQPESLASWSCQPPTRSLLDRCQPGLVLALRPAALLGREL